MPDVIHPGAPPRRLALPVERHEHTSPCLACNGLGVTGARYEMPAGDTILILEVICPDCGGCGNGDPEHASCDALWHADPEDFGDSGLDGEDEDGEEYGGCPSCGSGRGWFAFQGFTGTEVYTMRGICSCATSRLVDADHGPGNSG